MIVSAFLFTARSRSSSRYWRMHTWWEAREDDAHLCMPHTYVRAARVHAWCRVGEILPLSPRGGATPPRRGIMHFTHAARGMQRTFVRSARVHACDVICQPLPFLFTLSLRNHIRAVYIRVTWLETVRNKSTATLRRLPARKTVAHFAFLAFTMRKTS